MAKHTPLRRTRAQLIRQTRKQRKLTRAIAHTVKVLNSEDDNYQAVQADSFDSRCGFVLNLAIEAEKGWK